MKNLVTALGLVILILTLALADGAPRDQWGRAGILSSANKAQLPPITLSAGMPLADAPWGLTSGTVNSIEFDDVREMEIGCVAIKPGEYFLRIPGSTGETQRLDIMIE
jgi:hypothetical protein